MCHIWNYHKIKYQNIKTQHHNNITVTNPSSDFRVSNQTQFVYDALGQCPILEFFQNQKIKQQNIRILPFIYLQKREEFSLFFVSLRFGNGVK